MIRIPCTGGDTAVEPWQPVYRLITSGHHAQSRNCGFVTSVAKLPLVVVIYYRLRSSTTRHEGKPIEQDNWSKAAISEDQAYFTIMSRRGGYFRGITTHLSSEMKLGNRGVCSISVH